MLKLKHPEKPVLFFKEDLSHCFRQYHVDPGDIPLLGYCWRGYYYFDTVLMMGCRMAPAVAQRVSNMISWIHHYVDDFLGAEVGDNASKSHAALIRVLDGIGLERSPAKAIPPTTEIEFIGNLFNSELNIIGVTPRRRTELLNELNRWRFKPTTTRRQLESIIGKLQFVSNVVKSGRLFISRLLGDLRNMKRGPEYELSFQARQDLRWWSLWLPQFWGTAIMWMIRVLPFDSVISVDASLQGAGGVAVGSFYTSLFPEHWDQRNYHITHLELWAVIIAVKIWGPEL